MRQPPRRRREPELVCSDVLRLDHELRVLVPWIPPSTDLDVQFAMLSAGAELVPRHHAEHSRRIEASGVLNVELVRAVSQRARQNHLGARPSAVALRKLKIQLAVVVYGPGAPGGV